MTTPTRKQKSKPGPKPNPEISKLANELAVTRQHAAKLLRDSPGSDGLKGLRCRKLQLEIERLELALAEAKGELISRAEAMQSGVRIGTMISHCIQTAISNWPGQLAGLDEVGVRKALDSQFSIFEDSIRNGLDSITK